MINRRSFVAGIAGIVAAARAPAVVLERGVLMPVRSIVMPEEKIYMGGRGGGKRARLDVYAGAVLLASLDAVHVAEAMANAGLQLSGIATASGTVTHAVLRTPYREAGVLVGRQINWLTRCVVPGQVMTVTGLDATKLDGIDV